MSFNTDFDHIATIAPGANGTEPETVSAAVAPVEAPSPRPLPFQGETGEGVRIQEPPVAEAAAAEANPAPIAEATLAQPVVAPAAARVRRPRPRWVVPTAIAVVGLITAGALGYLFYSTSGKLDATRHQLALTQASLAGTKDQLASVQADAALKKQTADYLALYTADAGKVRTDYQQVSACKTYSQCRTGAQQGLADMQAFQADRKSATIPAALSSSDAQLGDSLSAAIVALQELITGMDTNSVSKIDDGFVKLNDAMLAMAKAESALGSEIR